MKTHINNAFAKIGVRNRTEAAVYATSTSEVDIRRSWASVIWPRSPPVAVVVDVMRRLHRGPWAFAQGAGEDRFWPSRWTRPWRSRPRTPTGWPSRTVPAAPAFDLVNSPGHAALSIDLQSGGPSSRRPRRGRSALLAVKDAPLVLCASFVVAEATARFLR